MQHTMEEQGPSLCCRKMAAKNYLVSMSRWVFLKNRAKPTETGFAIGSPGALHVISASDQIKASWVNADNNIIVIRFAKSSV